MRTTSANGANRIDSLLVSTVEYHAGDRVVGRGAGVFISFCD